MTRIWILLWCACTVSLAGKKLPDWALEVLETVPTQAPDAGVWVLLDETVVHDTGDAFQIRRRVLKQVLRNSDTEWAGIYTIDGSEDGTRIEKLQGYHRRADGRVEKLDKDNVIAIGLSSIESVSVDTTTLAFFEHVGKSSVVAFESTERVNSLFPVHRMSLLGPYPILKRVVRFEGQGRLELQRADALSMEATVSEQEAVFTHLPAETYERLMPRSATMPYIRVVASRENDRRLDSWDALASWYAGTFAAASTDQKTATHPAEQRADLQSAVEAVRGIMYRQRYLTRARGWQPLPGKQVDTLRYGDCKDMTSYMVWHLAAAGVTARPALCAVGEAPHISGADPPSTDFNHVILAVPLKQSLGLPAEVTVGDARYLLFDATDKHTPLGYLYPGHAGRSVMICTEQGAAWAAVPAQALEERALEVDLRNGSLNRQAFTLSADLEIVERGDAAGFRRVASSPDPWTLEAYLRRVLGLPAQVLLQSKSAVVEDGVFKAAWRVRWPDFLTPDLDGLRLPFAVTGQPEERLDQADRMHPIYFPERTSTLWRINVASDIVLQPVTAERSYEGPHHQFAYSANYTYRRLNVSLAQSAKEALFLRPELQEGFAAHKGYREAQNTLVLRDALFQKP